MELREIIYKFGNEEYCGVFIFRGGYGGWIIDGDSIIAKKKEGILVGARNNAGGPLWMTVQLVPRGYSFGRIFTCPVNGQNYCTNISIIKPRKKIHYLLTHHRTFLFSF